MISFLFYHKKKTERRESGSRRAWQAGGAACCWPAHAPGGGPSSEHRPKITARPAAAPAESASATPSKRALRSWSCTKRKVFTPIWILFPCITLCRLICLAWPCALCWPRDAAEGWQEGAVAEAWPSLSNGAWAVTPTHAGT